MNKDEFFQPSFSHLKRLTTKYGLLEHAFFNEPRIEHGYCVDDVARGLVLLCREPFLDPEALEMLEQYLDFILRAIAPDGRCHNRMNDLGDWIDEPGTGDWWGRAVWGLGFAAAHAPDLDQRNRANLGFQILAKTTSPDLKSIAFSVLGAGELLLSNSNMEDAKKILFEARKRFLATRSKNRIWPESRFSYSNASYPEAEILIGLALGDSLFLEHGLVLLEYLLSIETKGGHLSVAPVGGSSLDDRETKFDQQPIEIAALADACARAWRATGNRRWIGEVERAWTWFLGNNDIGVPMFDRNTGAGYDGLHARGPNRNQGAESTIAMLTTAQQALLVKKSALLDELGIHAVVPSTARPSFG